MQTKAQKRAVEKYHSEKFDKIQLRVPKGEKALIVAHAQEHGESLTRFVVRAIKETMERDQNKLKE